jgi:hypothetical protein
MRMNRLRTTPKSILLHAKYNCTSVKQCTYLLRTLIFKTKEAIPINETATLIVNIGYQL